MTIPLRMHVLVQSCCVAMLLSMPTAANAADAQSPVEFVVEATGELAAAVAARRDVLRADRAAREALIDKLILPRFDLETASRLILAERWRDAGFNERQRFVESFYHHLVAAYGDALPAFERRTITIADIQDEAAASAARVRVRLRLADGASFDAALYLRYDCGSWRIVDVIVEGISSIRTYRSDFGAEVRRDGLEALILRLEGTASD